MAMIGMWPASVQSAAGRLQGSAGDVNHAASAASETLAKRDGLPEEFRGRAVALQARARAAITSGDAFAISGIDLGNRARLLLEQDGTRSLVPYANGMFGPTPAMRAAERLPVLWNPATRDKSKHEPGKYFNDINKLLHPDGEEPDPVKGPPECKLTASGDLSADATATAGAEKEGGKDRPEVTDSDVPPDDIKELSPAQLKLLAEIKAAAEAGGECNVTLPAGISATAAATLAAEAVAEGHGNISINGVDVGGKLGATVSATGKITFKKGALSATAAAGVDAGLEIELDGSARVENGHLKLHWKATVAAGVGAHTSGDIDLDVGALLADDKPDPVVGAHQAGPNGPAVIDKVR